jgi:predicted alpha/beta-hydrolase family hydrolase
MQTVPGQAVSRTDQMVDGPITSERTVVLAHGAGDGMESRFLTAVARGLAAAGLRVIRFEFPYMARRRLGGTSRAPDRAPVLLDSWRSIIAAHGPADRLIIGGKSMGGRIASMVADECSVRGLVCFGYPFHPPGDRERLRTAHLEALATPTLIVQGERDPFGTRDEVARYKLSPAIAIHWIEDGDHSLVPRKKSGRTAELNLAEAIATSADFIGRL